jgi:small Trp-rich protein
MIFLAIGVILLALKLLEIGAVATWPWLAILSPFPLAVAWWAWADWSGFTKKKAMKREMDRKQARLDKQRDALGMGKKRR